MRRRNTSGARVLGLAIAIGAGLPGAAARADTLADRRRSRRCAARSMSNNRQPRRARKTPLRKAPSPRARPKDRSSFPGSDASVTLGGYVKLDAVFKAERAVRHHRRPFPATQRDSRRSGRRRQRAQPGEIRRARIAIVRENQHADRVGRPRHVRRRRFLRRRRQREREQFTRRAASPRLRIARPFSRRADVDQLHVRAVAARDADSAVRSDESSRFAARRRCAGPSHFPVVRARRRPVVGGRFENPESVVTIPGGARAPAPTIAFPTSPDRWSSTPREEESRCRALPKLRARFEEPSCGRGRGNSAERQRRRRDSGGRRRSSLCRNRRQCHRPLLGRLFPGRRRRHGRKDRASRQLGWSPVFATPDRGRARCNFWSTTAGLLSNRRESGAGARAPRILPRAAWSSLSGDVKAIVVGAKRRSAGMVTTDSGFSSDTDHWPPASADDSGKWLGPAHLRLAVEDLSDRTAEVERLGQRRHQHEVGPRLPSEKMAERSVSVAKPHAV